MISKNLGLCVTGIMFFFLLYGVTQEKLMTKSYNGRLFKDTAWLVFINRVVSIAFAFAFILGKREPVKPAAPIPYYIFIAVSNFLSTFCQYEALKYVSFPTQTLGKCGKIIPVLLIGTFVQRKVYSWKEYTVAVSIMFGCTMFLTTGTVSSKRAVASDSPWGLALIALYLFFDGFTSTTQERLFKQFKTSSYNQMFYVNISSAFIAITTLVSSGGGVSRLNDNVAFTFENPEFLFDAITLSLCSSLGQLIIYYTIKEFGALIYSTIMTTRQFFSVLLSNVLFAHGMSAFQWLGAVIVFSSLWFKTFIGNKNKKKDREDMAVRHEI